MQPFSGCFLSGVARPGLSPVLPASFPASPHSERAGAAAEAVLPTYKKSENLFPCRPSASCGGICPPPQWAGVGATGAVSPPPLLAPLLLSLPPRAAAGPVGEQLHWHLLNSLRPGLFHSCPAPAAAAGGARARPGAPAPSGRASPWGRGGIPRSFIGEGLAAPLCSLSRRACECSKTSALRLAADSVSRLSFSGALLTFQVVL